MDYFELPRIAQSADVGHDRADVRLEAPAKQEKTFVTGPDILQSTVKFPAGSIESITVPGTWKESRENSAGQGMLTRFSPHRDSQFNFAIFDDNRPIPATTQASLQQLLAQNHDLTVPKALTPQQINELTDMFDRSEVGDNQFSNKIQPPNPQCPVFQMSSAMLTSVNGRPVIEVKGAYVDQHGKPTNHYRGMFVPGEGIRVQQIFMQSPSKQEFDANNDAFRTIVNSARWR